MSVELTQSPEKIRVGHVVSTFEGSLQLLDCVRSEGVCVIESFCKLKGVMAHAEQIQQEYLDSVTLADVIPSKRQLARVSAEE